MTDKIFEIKGNELLREGIPFLSAITDIEDYLIINDLIVVLVNGKKLKSDRNIYCYGLDKIMKWQIPEPDKLHAHNYYTSIYLMEGRLKVYNINGTEVTLDEHNGNIVNKQLIK